MRLPYNILSGTYTKPRIFLCEVDKSRICQLETTNTDATLKFNSYSEISFEVARVYNDLITGQTRINPHYDKIETPRIIEVEDIGFFEIQGPDISNDGIKESKQVTAYSYEYTLSHKYLEDLYNDGTVGSVESRYIDEKYGGELPENVVYPIVTLYNPENPKLSLLHIILEEIYGWEIGDVDEYIATKSRQFNVDRISVYDFIMNDICEMFNCYATFSIGDFGEKNKINLYAEASGQRFKFAEDTTEFILDPKYQKIGTVSDNGYKTTHYTYDPSTGKLVLEKPLKAGNMLEVIGADLTDWETDVFVSFDNLSQEVSVDYDADAIKTVLTVEYGEGQNIREANLGFSHITDLSYYNTPEWMGQELYSMYSKYNEACQAKQAEYTSNVQKRLELAADLDYEMNRVSLGYSLEHNVTHETIGEYYIRVGDEPGRYNYVLRNLPDEYIAGLKYYKCDGVNLTETNISNLRLALAYYFKENSMEELIKLIEEFSFTNDRNLVGEPAFKMPFGTIEDAEGKLHEGRQEQSLLKILYKYRNLGAKDPDAEDLEGTEDEKNPDEMYRNMVVKGKKAEARDNAIKQFLSEILDQFGLNILEILKETYVKAQTAFIEAWDKADEAYDDVEVEDPEAPVEPEEDDELTDEEKEEIENEIKQSAKDYPSYYPILLILDALTAEIGASRRATPPATKSTGRYADYIFSKDGEKEERLGVDSLNEEIEKLIAANTAITESLDMYTWFYDYYVNLYKNDYKQEEDLIKKAKDCAEALMMRISPFLREDEIILDDIVSSELDTIVESLSIQEDALSAAYIELEKFSRPQLNFSMTMANIYALPEFEPIMDKFQLGNLIKVAIRPDCIKQSRLMQVNMGLDDFSSFSCEFGELASLRSQSDIHADLLSQAVSAGKQVATYSGAWTKGADKATSTDLKIQQGLLDAVTQIKAIDGTQDIVIDKYGIKLQKKNPNTGELDPRQAWFINNSLMFTDDNWKTSKAGLGEFTIDGETFYGLLAEAVIAGYIEGSKIVGGTIQIGEYEDSPGSYVFEVDESGNVKMLGGLVEFSMGPDGKPSKNTIDDMTSGLQSQIDTNKEEINNKIYDIEDTIDAQKTHEVKITVDGDTTFTNKNDQATLYCRVYLWNQDITNEIPETLFQWHRTSATTKTFIGNGTYSMFYIGIDDRYVNGSVFVDNELIESADYTYDIESGYITFNMPPSADSMIEVLDSFDTAWANELDENGKKKRQSKSTIITCDDINENANFICKVNI